MKKDWAGRTVNHNMELTKFQLIQLEALGQRLLGRGNLHLEEMARSALSQCVGRLLGKNMALVKRLKQILKVLRTVGLEDKQEVLFLKEIKTAHLYI